MSEYQLVWEPPCPDKDTHHVSPSPTNRKKAKIGQVQTQEGTTQIFSNMEGDSNKTSDTSPANYPHLVANDDLAMLVAVYQQKCQKVIYEVQTTHYWLPDTAFEQRKFIDQTLTQVIDGIKACPATVCTMGKPDMQKFLPGICHEDGYSLIKALSLYGSFAIAIDIDISNEMVLLNTRHNSTFNDKHDLGSAVDPNLYSYGRVLESVGDAFFAD